MAHEGPHVHVEEKGTLVEGWEELLPVSDYLHGFVGAVGIFGEILSQVFHKAEVVP